MKNKTRSKDARPKNQPTEEELQGPPPREATLLHDDRQRQLEEQRLEHTDTSPELTAGDVDADWERASSVGEEAPGGSTPTPDQDVVDEINKAWGVPRSPDEEVRTSAEILEARDAKRAYQEDPTEPA
ncbi:MAG TPA: DUF6335 family protein [Methylomirabilota bacterium]|jgi:hypothetical protein